jgi:hypothetical protein
MDMGRVSAGESQRASAVVAARTGCIQAPSTSTKTALRRLGAAVDRGACFLVKVTSRMDACRVL